MREREGKMRDERDRLRRNTGLQDLGSGTLLRLSGKVSQAIYDHEKSAMHSKVNFRIGK